MSFDDATALNPAITVSAVGDYELLRTVWDDKEGISPQTDEGTDGAMRQVRVQLHAVANAALSVTPSILLDATVANDDPTTCLCEVLDDEAVVVDSISLSPSAGAEDVEVLFDREVLGPVLRQPRWITIHLTASDDQGSDVQTVALTVQDPDCAAAFGEYGLAADINEDCRMTLEDFALMAAD